MEQRGNFHTDVTITQPTCRMAAPRRAIRRRRSIAPILCVVSHTANRSRIATRGWIALARPGIGHRWVRPAPGQRQAAEHTSRRPTYRPRQRSPQLHERGGSQPSNVAPRASPEGSARSSQQIPDAPFAGTIRCAPRRCRARSISATSAPRDPPARARGTCQSRYRSRRLGHIRSRRRSACSR